MGRAASGIDLSRVLSKYIGEIEKNPDRIFLARRERDSLLKKRNGADGITWVITRVVRPTRTPFVGAYAHRDKRGPLNCSIYDHGDFCLYCVASSEWDGLAPHVSSGPASSFPSSSASTSESPMPAEQPTDAAGASAARSDRRRRVGPVGRILGLVVLAGLVLFIADDHWPQWSPILCPRPTRS